METYNPEKERQVAFMVGPYNEQAQGTPVYFAIPNRAWEHMTGFKSHDFNLPLFGVPLQVSMTRCRDRAEGIALLKRTGLLEGTPNPNARKDWILLAAGQGRDGYVVLLVIPDAAMHGMRNHKLKHRFDLRSNGIPIAIELIARPTHAECMATLMAAAEGAPIRDVSKFDAGFQFDRGKPQ